jgi:hypothetical protein
MSDQRTNLEQATSSALHMKDEPADRGRFLLQASVTSLAVAAGIGLIWGQWLPLLVLICSMAVVWKATSHSRLQAVFTTDCSAGRSSPTDSGTSDSDVRMVLSAFAACLASATLIGIAARWIDPFRWLLSLSLFGLLVASLSALGLAALEKLQPARTRWATWSVLGLVSAGFTWFVAPPAFATIHPVFNTPVSGQSSARPAVLVETLDDTEHGGLGMAELYLSVQSSRFPSGVQVILPINRGNFQGCKYRFVQLPFEVEEGDTLTFDLVDDNQMTPQQEALVLGASRAGGFCVQLGGAILQPELDWIVRPTTSAVSESAGQSLVLAFRDSPFRSFGKGIFIVQPSGPRRPHAANPVALLDSGNYSRATVKVYFPDSPLSFGAATELMQHSPGLNSKH